MYGAELSHIHDVAFGDVARGASPEIIRLLRRVARRRTDSAPLVVEVGCGSGILARALVDKGFRVLGIDVSPHMIRLARARAPRARFRIASLVDAAMPRCDAVIAIGEVVTYVPGGLRPLRRFFDRVHRALHPGGILIFDFLESAARRTFPPKCINGEDWSLVVRADLDARGRVLTRRMWMGSVSIEREIHRVRIYSRQEIADALRASGFRVEMRRSFGSYRLLPGDVAVIAQKL